MNVKWARIVRVFDLSGHRCRLSGVELSQILILLFEKHSVQAALKISRAIIRQIHEPTARLQLLVMALNYLKGDEITFDDPNQEYGKNQKLGFTKKHTRSRKRTTFRRSPWLAGICKRICKSTTNN